MKIVNEKGKLFGLINLVDLIVIIVALLLVAFVAIKFVAPAVNNEAGTGDSGSDEMVVTLYIRGVMDYMKDQIKDVEIGSQLVAGNDFVPDTEVLSIEDVEYITAVNTDTGEINQAIDEQRYDVIVKIKAKQNKEDPIYKIATQEVRVGRGFVFKTQTVEQNAIVQKVEFVNE